MNETASKRLRWIGVGLIVLTLAGVLAGDLSVKELDLGSLLGSAALIGIGLLVLSEIAPSLTSFKAGDVEMTFANMTSDKMLVLEERIAQLERAAAESKPPASDAALAPKASLAPPMAAPALAREKRANDDQWKGRFGGMSERNGLRLRAEFVNPTSRFVEIQLIVERIDGKSMPPDTPVEFYLHETFRKDIIPAMFSGNQAELSVIGWGGFTVGVWVPSSETELELDLSTLKNAPRIVREL